MSKKRAKLSGQIRQAVRDSDLTNYRICKLIDVGQPQFSRFMAGKIGLSMALMDQLAELFDLTITIGPNAAKASDFPDARRKPHKGK
jgi:predicted XRE-type DNA-binding protein